MAPCDTAGAATGVDFTLTWGMKFTALPTEALPLLLLLLAALLAVILMLGNRPRCCLTATPASVTGPRACRSGGVHWVVGTEGGGQQGWRATVSAVWDCALWYGVCSVQDPGQGPMQGRVAAGCGVLCWQYLLQGTGVLCLRVPEELSAQRGRTPGCKHTHTPRMKHTHNQHQGPLTDLHHDNECIDGVLRHDPEGVHHDVCLTLSDATKQGRQLLQLGEGHLQQWVGQTTLGWQLSQALRLCVLPAAFWVCIYVVGRSQSAISCALFLCNAHFSVCRQQHATQLRLSSAQTLTRAQAQAQTTQRTQQQHSPA